MLKKIATGIALTAIAFFAIFVVWSSSSFHDCVKRQQTAYSKETNESKPPLFFARESRAAICIRCASHVIYEYRDAATAVATVFIALFTFTLWWSTKGMLEATKTAVDLARAEFISTHRPKIRLRRIKPILPLKASECVEALIEAANIGDTKATIFEIGVDIYIANQPFNARPAPIPILMVEPGKQANINVRGGQRLTQSQIANLGTGQRLRILGIINYRDDNGTIRTTSFARQYEPNLSRFLDVPSGDPDEDLNYEN